MFHDHVNKATRTSTRQERYQEVSSLRFPVRLPQLGFYSLLLQTVSALQGAEPPTGPPELVGSASYVFESFDGSGEMITSHSEYAPNIRHR